MLPLDLIGLLLALTLALISKLAPLIVCMEPLECVGELPSYAVERSGCRARSSSAVSASGLGWSAPTDSGRAESSGGVALDMDSDLSAGAVR